MHKPSTEHTERPAGSDVTAQSTSNLPSSLDPMQLYSAAIANYNSKAYTLAAENLEKAISLFESMPSQKIPHIKIAHCHSTLASCHRELNNYDTALIHCETALRIFDRHNKKKVIDVIKKYHTCLERQGHNAVSLYKEACALYNAKEYCIAASKLTFVLKKFETEDIKDKNDRIALTHSTLASCYEKMSDIDTAIEHANMALTQYLLSQITKPDDVTAVQKKLDRLKHKLNAIINFQYNAEQPDIHVLPNELLSNSFSFFKSRKELVAARLTCKRFFQISTIPSIMQQFPQFDYSKVASTYGIHGEFLRDKTSDIALARDGTVLAVISKSGYRIDLYNKEKNIIKSLRSQDEYLTLLMSKDNQYIIAVRFSDGSLDIWDIQKEKIINHMPHPSAPHFGTLFLYGDNHTILTIKKDEIVIVNFLSGKPLSTKTSHGAHYTTTSVSDDEKLLVGFIAAKKTIHLIDIASGKVIEVFENMPYCHSIKFSHDNKKIIYSADAGLAIVDIHTKTHTSLTSTPFPFSHISISSDDHYIAVINKESIVTLWNAYTKKCVATVKYDNPFNFPVGPVRILFTPDDNQLIIKNSMEILLHTFPRLTLSTDLTYEQTTANAAKPSPNSRQ